MLTLSPAHFSAPHRAPGETGWTLIATYVDQTSFTQSDFLVSSEANHIWFFVNITAGTALSIDFEWQSVQRGRLFGAGVMGATATGVGTHLFHCGPGTAPSMTSANKAETIPAGTINRLAGAHFNANAATYEVYALVTE